MSCVWRDIASYLPGFFACLVAGGLVLFGWRVCLLVDYGYPWWRMNQMTLEELRGFNRWLRDTGRGRIIIAQRLWLAVTVLVVLWLSISPRLKPLTECLPQAEISTTLADFRL
jgi:hypothetical protein